MQILSPFKKEFLGIFNDRKTIIKSLFKKTFLLLGLTDVKFVELPVKFVNSDSLSLVYCHQMVGQLAKVTLRRQRSPRCGWGSVEKEGTLLGEVITHWAPGHLIHP